MGSQSKLGVDFPVKAYKLSENRYTLEDIKASIPSCKVDLAPLYEKPRRKSTVTLEEAKELYPEWYEKRIVQGEPKQKSKKQGGTWVCNEALYEWWKRKITEEVKAGGRYFSIMALCSYGLKCGISEQKIRELEESKNSFFRYEGLKLYLFWGGMVCNILVFLMLLYGMISK
ncbi:hypothetical protein FRR55_11135 [Campylobacter coli]|nr:hypothetical protein [Campylobacter coli]ECK7742147.1 hypothetical protein [Campylobacter coli]ECK7775219.1 hypothetical protein [Campylobacter coli]ECK7776751.1 hypothetical protein [Campylobacter coli]